MPSSGTPVPSVQALSDRGDHAGHQAEPVGRVLGEHPRHLAAQGELAEAVGDGDRRDAAEGDDARDGEGDGQRGERVDRREERHGDDPRDGLDDGDAQRRREDRAARQPSVRPPDVVAGVRVRLRGHVHPQEAPDEADDGGEHEVEAERPEVAVEGVVEVGYQVLGREEPPGHREHDRRPHDVRDHHEGADERLRRRPEVAVHGPALRGVVHAPDPI